MNDAAMVSVAKLPIGKFGGILKHESGWDLGTTVIAEAVKRAGVKGDDIDEVIMAHGPETGRHGWSEGEVYGTETCLL